MDPFTEKQIEINLKKETVIGSYPKLWRKMLTEWSIPKSYDRGWMFYSANYLFHTAGVRWAIDPLRLAQRIPNAPDMDVSPLAKLDFIILTHQHTDHLDLGLLQLLQNYPAIWIVPETLLDQLRSNDLQPKKIMIPSSLEQISMKGIILTSFEGFHWEVNHSHENGQRGVPSTGYMVEFNGKRWLFPGDTRSYAPDALRHFSPVDVLFAHLWLGRGCAFQETPALLEAFCLFCLSSQPKRIIVTHLEEFGRLPGDYWDDRHFALVVDWFREHAPEIQLEVAFIGDCIVA